MKEYPEEVEVFGILHEDPDVATEKVLAVVRKLCVERAALEGGVSRTEPALTDRQIAGIAGCIVAPNDRLWNLYFARAILVATKGQS